MKQLKLILLMSLLVTACSTNGAIKQHEFLAETTPQLLLPHKSQATLQGGGFAGPLFGLATAPNGEILVADAGAGIASLGKGALIPLPGVSDISPIGRGTIWAVTGPQDPTVDSGQALHLVSAGKTHLLANLFAFEAANDPDGAGVDSNPFDVQSLGGRAALVTNAGGNDLLRVDNQGNIKLLAVFPDELVSTANAKALFGCPAGPPDICNLPNEIPAQAVPTSVVIGPDGYYVSELKGFPAPTNASNIWRVSPNASGTLCGSSPDCVKVFDGGFTSIIDLAFDAKGTLYVAELDEQSWAAVEILGGGVGGTINACDLDALTCSEVATGIPILSAITFGKDGNLWATENAPIPADWCARYPIVSNGNLWATENAPIPGLATVIEVP
jgi:hypothetical protein